jgi:hypothetical protein
MVGAPVAGGRQDRVGSLGFLGPVRELGSRAVFGIASELVGSTGQRLGAGAGRGEAKVARGLKVRGLRDADLLASWVVGDRRCVGSLVAAVRQGRAGSRGCVGPDAVAGGLLGWWSGWELVYGWKPAAVSSRVRCAIERLKDCRLAVCRRPAESGGLAMFRWSRCGSWAAGLSCVWGAAWCGRPAGLNGSRWAWCGGRRLGPAWSWLGRGSVVVAVWLRVPVSAAVSRWGAGALARARWFAVGRALLEAPDQGGQR